MHSGYTRRLQATTSKYHRRIDELKAKHRAAQTKIDEMKAANSEQWKTFKAGIDGHYGNQRKVVIMGFGAVSRGAIYALKARMKRYDASW